MGKLLLEYWGIPIFVIPENLPSPKSKPSLLLEYRHFQNLRLSRHSNITILFYRSVILFLISDSYNTLGNRKGRNQFFYFANS